MTFGRTGKFKIITEQIADQLDISVIIRCIMHFGLQTKIKKIQYCFYSPLLVFDQCKLLNSGIHHPISFIHFTSTPLQLTGPIIPHFPNSQFFAVNNPSAPLFALNLAGILTL